MAALGLVKQIHAEDTPVRQLQHLEHQEQIALQAGGVPQHQDAVGLLTPEIFGGNPLLLRPGAEGICAGQIHQPVGPPLIAVAALGHSHSFSRPIAGMLAEPRQGIEQGALPHIGVSHQRTTISSVSEPLMGRSPLPR